jgi:hypothetical protein
MSKIVRKYVEPAELIDVSRELLSLGCRFQMAYHRYDGPSLEIVYLVDRGPNLEFLEMVVRS